MNNNTVSKYPTHFLQAVELIEKAHGTFKVPTENWSIPSPYRIGDPQDHYYAEIWSDGMDWQSTYWLLEQAEYNTPICEPFIMFDRYEDEEHLEVVAGELFRAMLKFRRNAMWLKREDYDEDRDNVWFFMWTIPGAQRHAPSPGWSDSLIKVGISHASQRPVEFWANQGCIHPKVLTQTRPARAVDPPNYRRIVKNILDKENLDDFKGISKDLDDLIGRKGRLNE